MSAPSWLVNDYLSSGACLERSPSSKTATGALPLPAGTEKPEPAVMCPPTVPPLTVIINNYNGAPWLERCLASLHSQTIFQQLEVIVADDASPDQSATLAEDLTRHWPNARVVRNPTNLGFCLLNNGAAEMAHGRFVFFVNNDTWMEPDCLERLLAGAESAGASVAMPLVQDYADEAIQTAGEAGFDIFGFISHQMDWSQQREIMVASGTCLLIETRLFRELGGFDKEFTVFADEYDLCWRVWVTGGKVILVPTARLRHRGGAGVNPLGGGKWVENRTCDTKRFLANRNNLLVLLKNCQHILLLLVPLQLLLLAVEAAFMAALTRRWSHVRRAYVEALCDCWRLRHHIMSERRRLAALRRRGDFWMLRFLRAPLNRWGEFRRMTRIGLLKVDAK
jgi:GT2 family glycosyltransferase